MHSGKTKFAQTYSTNTLDFKFPYGGEQHARLVARQNYDGSHDILLSVEKGQFIVSVRGGSALVKFDNAAPVKFDLSPPQDASSTVVFFNDADTFLNRLYAAKKVYIQTEIYNEGEPVIEFNVSELNEF